MSALRVENHPVLGEQSQAKMIKYYLDGRECQAREGEPIAAALMANGIRIMRTTAVHDKPRGIYCAIGRCTDCMMTVDGEPNVRTCVTPIRAGMRIETQKGLGSRK